MPAQEGLPGYLLDRVDVLRGRQCQISELEGGLTNHNFKVITDDGSYVVRVCNRGSERGLTINREHEYRNTAIAAMTTVGAPAIAFLPEDLVMVLGYIDGITFTDASFEVPDNVERVASACRRLHEGPRFVNDFNMFEIQKGYLEKVTSRGYRLPAG